MVSGAARRTMGLGPNMDYVGDSGGDHPRGDRLRSC